MPLERLEHKPATDGTGPARIRVAAAADIHCRADGPNPAVEALAAAGDEADLLLIAGDLTTYGRPEDAQALADIGRDLDIPVLAVLGNHDWHSGQADAVTAVLEEGGIGVLERSWRIERVGGLDVGVVGVKGFVGGFAGSHLPDFGEPSLREIYRECGEEVEALERGLREIEMCPLRIVVMHYSPTTDTLQGERPEIWTFLGTDRLAAPLLEHEPDLVVHGHAHGGTFKGAIGEVEVFNVSFPVIDRAYWLFELGPVAAASTPIR
jgi:Icc-related predicted phosphoesterase